MPAWYTASANGHSGGAAPGSLNPRRAVHGNHDPNPQGVNMLFHTVTHLIAAQASALGEVE